MTTSIKIIKPDDWHVHFREDEMLKVVTKYSARVNRRCIAMPNTSTPITSSHQAINYKKLIESNSQSTNFQALIPCYLTDSLNICLLYTAPSPRDMRRSRMPSSA